MKCPLCGHMKTEVRATYHRIDNYDGEVVTLIRRYRRCKRCMKWHTTVEIVESSELTWMPKFGMKRPENIKIK